MAEQYKLILENGTDQPWHFGVYQKVPTSPGLSSVAWQVRGIPPQASERASQAEVNWTMSYGVCIAKFDRDQDTYTGSQYAPALLSNSYKVLSVDGICLQFRLAATPHHAIGSPPYLLTHTVYIYMPQYSVTYIVLYMFMHIPVA